MPGATVNCALAILFPASPLWFDQILPGKMSRKLTRAIDCTNVILTSFLGGRAG